VPGFKYLVHRSPSATTELLYDISRDPGEKEPLRAGGESAAAVIETLRSQLQREESMASALRGDAPADAGVELPEDMLEQLRALGYAVEQ
jgi:hypothetical protein